MAAVTIILFTKPLKWTIAFENAVDQNNIIMKPCIANKSERVCVRECV